MAKAFLTQLPRVRRGILGKDDQRCFICMEDYGTTPSASGIIEHAVKLPCNHIMGSECISIWVSNPAPGGDGGGGNSNQNTCPMCRQVLFEVQPPSKAEHRRIHTVLTNRCVGICAQLGLYPNPGVVGMARAIANNLHDRVRFENAGFEETDFGDRSAQAVAAASVFMSSHLMRDVRSLEMVSSCVDVGDDAVRRAYNFLHVHRFWVVRSQLLEDVGYYLSMIDGVLPAVLA